MVFAQSGEPSFSTFNDNALYTRVDFPNDWTLFWSKNTTDNLPLMSTKVEYKPCMNHDERSNGASKFYPLEQPLPKDCSINPSTEVAFDPRYINTGYCNAACFLLLAP